MTVEELPPERRGGYEVAPRRIGDDGGRGRGTLLRRLAALVTVVALALVVAKPWATEEPLPTETDPSAEAAAPTPSLPAEALFSDPAPSAPAASIPPLQRSEAGLPIARALVGYGATWGVGTGGWWVGDTAPWTTWTSSVNLFEGVADGPRSAPACDRLIELPVGRFVAVGAPSGLAADSPITATRYLPDGSAVAIPDLVSISRPADEGIAYLFLNDGATWPAGPHRFVVATPAGPVTLDACLTVSGAAVMREQAAIPGGILDTGGLEPLAASLGEYAGRWGIATGGWRSNGTAWSRWQLVAPRRTSSGEVAILAAPDCGDMDAMTPGVVVAVTAPVPIADPRDVVVFAFGPDGASRVLTEVRRLPRGVDGRLVPLFRADGEPWRSGAYRFLIWTGDAPVALDACFLSLASAPGAAGLRSAILAP